MKEGTFGFVVKRALFHSSSKTLFLCELGLDGGL